MTTMVAPPSSSRSNTPTSTRDVDRVQPGRGFVEDVEDAALAAAQPRRDAQPLRLAAGQRRRGLPQAQVAEADVVDRAGAAATIGACSRNRLDRVVDGQAEDVGDGQPVEADVEDVASLSGRRGRCGQLAVMSGRYCTSRSMSPSPRHVGHWPARVLNEKCPGFHRWRRAARRVRRTGCVIWSKAPGVGRRGRPRVLADRRGVDLARPGGSRRGRGRGRGRAAPTRQSCARAAGTRLSRTRAVLPGAGRPGHRGHGRRTGKAAVTSCRLYRSPTVSVISPAGACPRGAVRPGPVPPDGRRAGQEGPDDRVRGPPRAAPGCPARRSGRPASRRPGRAR